MTRFSVVLVLLSCSIVLAKHDGLCNVNGCVCSAAGHPSWLVINCSLPPTQTLNILDGDLPESTSELIVNGSDAVMLGPNSLSRLRDLRHVRVTGAKLVVLRRAAAVDLNVVNAFLEFEDCAVLRVEEKSFSNIRGPLTVAITNCDYVSMEGDAFSWLLKMTINNVPNLNLSSGSFKLDPTAANVGEHGPGMSIELKNITSPEFPAYTFGSSAAEIVIKKSSVSAVRSLAFAANTYNVIMASDSSFDIIEEEAFAQKSLINNLHFSGCKVKQMRPRAIQSAVTKLDISHSTFDYIETGSINATVASVKITDSVFHAFMGRGFELSSWNKFHMARNKFDHMAPNAILAPTTVVHELFFVDNEIEALGANTFGFVGQTFDSKYAVNVVYKNNYYGVPCHCNISIWLANGLGTKHGEPYEKESYCTVNEFFARCFNEPEQNMAFKKFLDNVCSDKFNIQCEKYKTKTEGKPTEIKNPRFPHKKEETSLSDSDKKVIGIVVLTALGCIIIVIIITFARCMKRRGYCRRLKNLFSTSNTPCGSICNRLCVCGTNSGLDNGRSISQLSVNEFSERRRLNEPRGQEIMLETTMSDIFCVENYTPMDDKTTQTLPEELTKELLEHLKRKLDHPEDYVEAREMIEHLYELVKVEERPKLNQSIVVRPEENIYELPFQNTPPRIGKNKKQMISVGTHPPSLESLLPFSPYNRQTALAHEYFEPKDFAVHLYAEIANHDREKRNRLGMIPDVVGQLTPLGSLECNSQQDSSHNISRPYTPFGSSKKTPVSSPTSSHMTSPLLSPATVKSNKSSPSNSSGKMFNRPLPEKPMNKDAEGNASTAVAMQG